jgi:transposase-like protein
MNRKIRPSDEISKKFTEMLRSETEEVFKEFFKTAIEKTYQECLEQEVSDYLGRGWYERQTDEGSETERDFRGYRNGYTDKRIRGREGILNIKRPRIRDSEEPYESRILSKLDIMEERLNRMALEMYVRGLSTRDIEETLTDTNGKPIISRSGVSELNERLHDEYEEFKKRDLSSLDVVYLFVDGVYEAVRRYTSGQTILCGWAILSDGGKVMLDLSAVASESEEAWSLFFEEMKARGLRQPLLITSDGAKGLTKL